MQNGLVIVDSNDAHEINVGEDPTLFDILDATIFGFGGNDTIDGKKRNANLIGGSGNGILNGHGGNDILDGGTGGDMKDGGAGKDVVRFDAASGGVTLDLINGTGSGGDGVPPKFCPLQNGCAVMRASRCFLGGARVATFVRIT